MHVSNVPYEQHLLRVRVLYIIRYANSVLHILVNIYAPHHSQQFRREERPLEDRVGQVSQIQLPDDSTVLFVPSP
jgi:hypothetical protein